LAFALSLMIFGGVKKNDIFDSVDLICKTDKILHLNLADGKQNRTSTATTVVPTVRRK
jgi:transcriptional antiterminator Rof (Rho-off)